jgi:hypothetical protein
MVDSAIHAKNLLDTLSISGYVAAGVSRVIEKRGNGNSVLLKTDVEELQLIADALDCQQELGRQQVQKISGQHYLLSSYDKKARADRLKEEETPARSNEPLFIRKLKDFKRACKNEMKNAAKENISPPPLPSINEKEAARRSERQINKISLEKTTSAYVKKEYNGQPPFPYTRFTSHPCNNKSWRKEENTTKSYLSVHSWKMLSRPVSLLTKVVRAYLPCTTLGYAVRMAKCREV